MKSFWILVAGLLFAGMGVFVKLASVQFSNMELVFVRSLVGLVLISAFVGWRRLSVRTSHWRLQLFRAVFTTFALFVYFYAIAHLPLAVAVTLHNTGPLFVIPLAAIVVKERPNHLQVFGITVGFVGVALLLQPEANQADLVPMIIGLGSGFFNGITLVTARQLGLLNEPEWRVVFYLTVVATVIASGWIVLTTSFSPITVESVPILLGLGLTGTGGQLAVSRAYKKGRTLFVAALTYSNVVFASILGAWLWGEVLPLRSWLAFGVIALGGVLASSRTVPAAGRMTTAAAGR